MMRNLARINNYYQRIEAWKDWEDLKARVIKAGHGDLVLVFAPAPDAGWRKVDKAAYRLVEALAKRGVVVSYGEAAREDGSYGSA